MYNKRYYINTAALLLIILVSFNVHSQTEDHASLGINRQPVGVFSSSSTNTDPIGSTLSIELINFTAKLTNTSSVKLDWITETEINNDYFTIEHSSNAYDWEYVEDINGAGNSSLAVSYSINDEQPYQGVSYYRIKQTDFDGKFTFSRLVSVNVKDVEMLSIEFYPNPADNQITITGDVSELETINLYNILGENVIKNIPMTTNDNQKKVLDLSELSSGVYILKTKTTTNKIYKQ